MVLLSIILKTISIDAFFNIGYLYELGLGVEKDVKMAMKYYKKEAEGVRIDSMKIHLLEII